MKSVHLEEARRAAYRTAGVLSSAQICAVVKACRKSACDYRRHLWRNNLVVFELATCAGLRVKEMLALQIQDVAIAADRPHLVLTDRIVPLTWSPWLMEDIGHYLDYRFSDGADGTDRLLVSLKRREAGQPDCSTVAPHRTQVHSWFATACSKAGVIGKLACPAVGRETFIAAAGEIPCMNAEALCAVAGVPLDGPPVAVSVLLDPAFDGLLYNTTQRKDA